MYLYIIHFYKKYNINTIILQQSIYNICPNINLTKLFAQTKSITI